MLPDFMSNLTKNFRHRLRQEREAFRRRQGGQDVVVAGGDLPRQKSAAH